MTMRDRLLALLASAPGLTDREMTDRLLGGTGKPQQSINALARSLEAAGLVVRNRRADGHVGNYLAKEVPVPAQTATTRSVQGTKPSLSAPTAGSIGVTWPSEDAVKSLIGRWLEAEGWTVWVNWGRDHGIDMEARRGVEHWLIEVKGGGSLQPMRVNYFLCILGETLQRMSHPSARYSIALPDLAQFRALWQRLPALAKERTTITALFVDSDGKIDEQH